MEGCQILNGIILAHETIHSLKVIKKPWMLLKMDMSKDFNRLNWTFLQEILIFFCFRRDWVAWVSNLISSAFFSILINGSPSHSFKPSRGILQGDPISPFLYIIVVEGIGIFIKSTWASSSLKGISISPTSNPLTHLQFVDNTLLMGVPSVIKLLDFKSILDTFMKFSSSLINLSNSHILFSTLICRSKEI